MLKPPSLITTYTLIFSGDPALVLPADPKERTHALELARETGRWETLIGPDQTPTTFELRPLPGTAFDWWMGTVRRERLSDAEANALLLRLALRKVEHFGAHRVELHRLEGQELATPAIIDALYAEGGEAGRQIVAELGGEVFARAERALRPKS